MVTMVMAMVTVMVICPTDTRKSQDAQSQRKNTNEFVHVTLLLSMNWLELTRAPASSLLANAERCWSKLIALFDHG
jgi:hypothetical protein